ncbi:hypothetical protein Hjap01_03312 [Haloarcula japonica]
MALYRNDHGNEEILNCLATKFTGHQVFTIEPSTQDTATEAPLPQPVATPRTSIHVSVQ